MTQKRPENPLSPDPINYKTYSLEPSEPADDHKQITPPPEAEIKPDEPLILHNRVLKSSIFFTLVWLLIAFISFMLIQTYHFKSNSIEFLILILAAIICFIMAIHSLDTYGGPFLYFNKDHLKIRHSMIRRILIPYGSIKSITVVKEELEIFKTDGTVVALNLAQLSFEDQAVCLKKLNSFISPIPTTKK